MITHQKRVETLLKGNSSSTDWILEFKYFNKKFIHLQWERFIHLIVTMTVGLATLISCFATMTNPVTVFFILDAILMVLFFAYILHYRKLENLAQSWYPLLDQLQAHAKNHS